MTCYSIFTYKLNGGEFVAFTKKDKNNNEEKFSPSISQLKFSNYVDRTITNYRNYLNGDGSIEVRKNQFENLIDNSNALLTKMATYKYDNEDVTMDYLTTPHLISDANADLFGLLMLRDRSKLDIKNAFAASEFHASKKFAEKKELLTIYNASSGIKIKKSGDSKNSNLSSVYSEEPVKSLISNSKKVKIYLEYSYDSKARAYELYRLVHLDTGERLVRILEDMDFEEADELVKFVFMKIDPTTTSPNISIFEYYDLEDNDGRSMRIYGNKLETYSRVVVPKTKGEFSYDEAIFLEVVRNDSNYFIEIQIEHSEGKSSHKSNLVEFIARNIVPFAKDEKDVRNCFSTITSYEFGDDGRFKNPNYKTKENKKPSNLGDETLVKSFGKYGKDFFDI